MRAFAGEVTQTIEIPDLREAVDRNITSYLKKSVEKNKRHGT
jgi:hypothetical protein